MGFLLESHNMEVKFSVVIPVYNVKSYLSECVNSVLYQTYDDYEIVLVDDGSTDGSSELCDKYAKEKLQVRAFHQKNQGVAAARNFGIGRAYGDYIIFVDSDDWIDPKTLEYIKKCIDNRKQIDVIIFSYAKEYGDNSYIKYVIEDNQFSEDELSKVVYRRLFGLTNSELKHPESLEYMSTCWGKAYRKECLQNYKFQNIEKIGSFEDGLFNMDVLNEKTTVVYINKPLYHYRYTKNSLSSKYRPNLKLQWEKLFSIIQRKINENFLPIDFQEAFNNRIALSVLGIGMNEIGNPNLKFFKFNRYIRNYISTKEYRNAVSTMKLKELPIAWKIMMFCSKYRLAFGISLILYAARFLKSKL